ncbi:MAG: hypothetical protein KKD83_10445 [Chloroflexi bacterium]|nr:hypothetical protein [Chloroflexota bacterium]
MGVLDIYSKRKRLLEKAGQPDVYTYNDLPDGLRVQVIHIWRDTLGRYKPHYNDDAIPNKNWVWIHDKFCRELGLLTLDPPRDNAFNKCCEYILHESDVDNVLSLIELSFSFIDLVWRDRFYIYKDDADATQDPDDAIEELNDRFKEHGIGYQYVSGRIITVDSQYIHTEVVRPAISLLHEAGFEGASEEFLKSHEHYRKGRNKEAIAEALKAFESTMKSICTSMGWEFHPNATAKPLLDICFSKNLIPQALSSHFDSLRSTLESGLPTVSNRLARHGQGQKKVIVPDHIAAYALHLTATNVVFLVESYARLKK